ncbi:MAG TPA: peptidylprolyl isomerase, partial [Flavobacteriales bacterium]|nr:peptidylprolyl isomerase [Flavobacteriales bacterium]
MKALTQNLVVVFLSTLLLTAVVSAQEIAVIETKFGKIEVGLFEGKAPGHVKNFKDLAR